MEASTYGRLLRDAIHRGTDFDNAGAFDSYRKIVEAIASSGRPGEFEFEFDAVALELEGGTTFNYDALKLWLDYHCTVCRIGYGLAFISENLLAGQSVTTPEGKLRPELIQAIATTEAAMDKSRLPQLEHPRWAEVQEVKEAATGKWQFLIADVMSWIDKCRVLVRFIKTEMITRLAEEAVDIANGLAKHHVETNHFVNDKIFNKAIAKKTLVHWPRAEYYSANSKELFERVSHIAEIHSKLELEITLEDLIEKQLISCKTVLSKAEQLLALRAAVVCLEGNSDARDKEAEKLLGKDFGLPKSVVTALQAIVHCGQRNAKAQKTR